MSALDEWCQACGSLHPAREPCTEEKPATGPERHSWRTWVKTRHGTEGIGVLVAPVESAWRARILTYPDELWTVSRGAGVLKFYADTPQRAESDAVEYIREFLKKAGLEPLDTEPSSRGDKKRSSSVRGSSIHQTAGNRTGLDTLGMEHRCRRKLCGWQVRFGHNALNRRADLANVSERGLFIETGDPLETGSVIRLELDAGGTTIPLRGTVVWVRVAPASGRPIGMGLRLARPPAMYLDVVKKLA